MVNVQMLSELEEVIQYKLVPERRPAIKQMWWDRLQVCVLSCVVSINMKLTLIKVSLTVDLCAVVQIQS